MIFINKINNNKYKISNFFCLLKIHTLLLDRRVDCLIKFDSLKCEMNILLNKVDQTDLVGISFISSLLVGISQIDLSNKLGFRIVASVSFKLCSREVGPNDFKEAFN